MPKEVAKRYAINKAGDTLLALFFDAATGLELVQLILENNKVYVALVSVAPDLKPSEPCCDPAGGGRLS